MAGIRDEFYRWPDGVIPYKVDPKFSSRERLAIKKAMTILSEGTCISFTPKEKEDTDYIQIVKLRGQRGFLNCGSSDVGKQGGRQDLYLGYCSRHVGKIIHELVHAIGFFHEHERADRDEHYFDATYGNRFDVSAVKHDKLKIRHNSLHIAATFMSGVEMLQELQGHEHNFEMFSDSEVDNFGVKYDFYSIMHYPLTAFSESGRRTIQPLKKGVKARSVGQRIFLTKQDFLKINRMYNCSKKRQSKK